VPAGSAAVKRARPDEPPLEWLARANRATLLARLLPSTVHEVSNALQVMSGAAEMLTLTPTPDAVAQRSTSITAQAMTAHALLQQLVAFVRAQPLSQEPAADLRGLCERVVEMRAHALRKLGAEVVVEGPAGVRVAGSAGVMQALLNLAANAEQACAGRTPVALRFTVTATDARATVDVADTGPGLTRDLDALCAWPPPQPSDGALGIGLRVSRALVAASGGMLEHVPSAGPGAVLRVTLPRLAD
jgi:signal transduction histidine kinase